MFVLTQEQKEIRKHLKGLKEAVRFHGIKNDDLPKFMNEALMLAAKQGYLGICVPESYGGVQLDLLTAVTVLVELAKVNASLAHIVNGHCFCFCKPITIYGNDQQKEFFLHKLATGKKIGIWAVTEPGGCNLDNIELTARYDGNCYVLNGTKSMITYAKSADYALVFVKTGSKNDELERSYSFLIVDLKTEGINIGRTELTMGMEGTQIAEINFNDCIVPADSLLGMQGDGLKIIGAMVEVSRTANAAVALGIAEAAYEEAEKYSRNRMLNGKPLIEHPYLNYLLADMYCKLKSIELTTYYAAQLLDNQNSDMYINSSIAKYNVTETAIKICDKALQIHGGHGYIKDYYIEQLYRDVRIHNIMGGSSEILKATIGDMIIKLNL